MAKGVLIDLTRCIGCRGCQAACKVWNDRPVTRTAVHDGYTNPVKLSAASYTLVRFIEQQGSKGPVWSFVKDQCLHCKQPACVSVCPVGALVKTEAGPVTYNPEPCIGCRYCMLACPFHIPKYEWESNSPSVRKCSFCAERLSEGLAPICVKGCPTGAMYFDELDKVTAEARTRLAAHPGRYVDYIYGLEEAGGTSWLYISDVPFERLGFNMAVPKFNLPDTTWQYITGVPAMLGVVLAAGVGGWLITRRNRLMDKEEPK